MLTGHALKKFLGIESRFDAIKVAVMALCFFVVLGSYTLVREMKDSVFLIIVGLKYLPHAKFISLVVMLPLLYFYSWLSGKVKKHWLIAIYSLIYGIGGLISVYFLNHETIGLSNIVASPERIFGWIFYLFFEGYAPFVVSVLWAFMNSISKPGEIKNRYVLITVASKTGGILSAGLAWLLLSKYFIAGQALSETMSHVYVFLAASLALLLVPLLILYLVHSVPCEYLRGYGEKKSETCDTTDGATKDKSGSGFMLLFKHPYVLGIFGMIFFWEAINATFNYMRLGVGLAGANDSTTALSSYLYKSAMLVHLVGLIIALVGTSSLINILGERFALMLIPLSIGCAIFVCLFYQTTTITMWMFIFMRAVNYSFAYPLREGLYIPTSNAIKFKTKSWIDSFGTKFSKGSGSFYNIFIGSVPLALVQSVQFGFYAVVIFLWTLLAYAMGRQWAKTVQKGSVIGKNDN